jgi:hypothetical protein
VLEYPPDLPAASQARLERKLAELELAAIDAGPPEIEYQMFVLDDRPTSWPSWPSTPAPVRPRPAAWDPVNDVLAVLELAIEEFGRAARLRHWSTTQLRGHVERFRDQLTTRIFSQRRPAQLTLDDLETQAHQRLHKCAWWASFQQALHDDSMHELTATAPEPRHDARPVKASFGKQLAALLDEARWSNEALAGATSERTPPGLSKRAIEALRADSRTPRPQTVALLEDTLSAKLHRTITFHVPRTRRRRRAVRTSVKRR